MSDAHENANCSFSGRHSYFRRNFQMLLAVEIVHAYLVSTSSTWSHIPTTMQKHKSRVMRKPTFWFPTWSDTNQAVQSRKMARDLNFRIYEVEGLYYPCSENKGADQLRGYCEADLRLCFCICKMLVFS